MDFDKIKDLKRSDQENLIKKYISYKRLTLNEDKLIESVKSLPDNIWIALLKSFLEYKDIETVYSNLNCNSCNKYIWSGYTRHGSLYITYFDHIQKNKQFIYCYECKDKCGCNSPFFKNQCNNCFTSYCDKHHIGNLDENSCNKCRNNPIFINILKTTYDW